MFYRITYKHSTWTEEYTCETIREVADLIERLVSGGRHKESQFKIEYVEEAK